MPHDIPQDPQQRNHWLEDRLDDLDARIGALEAAEREETLGELGSVLPEGAGIMRDLLLAYAGHAGKPMPASEDLLEVQKAFVKGDPSLNAVRDNVRELVFYQNCLASDRADALPPRPATMMVRTLRHVYLYLRTRCLQEDRLP